MRRFIFRVFPTAIFLLIGSSSLLFAQPKSAPSALKESMFNFQVLLADLEMMKGNVPLDWQGVENKLAELKKNVGTMQKRDPGGYGGNLRSLSSKVGEMERLAKKKDPSLFDRIDSIKKDCFQCHSTHRVLNITHIKD